MFAYGFRPFFLLAGVYACVSIGRWLWLLHRGAQPLAATVPQFWHGHELLFGFVTAAIAGFMLTAVPSWTGRRGFGGAPLVLLVLLWIAGRVAFSLQDALPWTAVVIVELAFYPALMITIGPSLLRTVNRNTPLLLVLLALWCCDAASLQGIAQRDIVLASGALRAALDVVLLLVTIIGGRIVPAFTANALRARGADVTIQSLGPLETAVFAAMIVYAVADIVSPHARLTAIVAAVAGVLQFWRLSRWKGLLSLSQPIVWVLHLGYLWLPVGLILKASYLTTGAAFAAHWLHALGAGAAATMILAVMTRAALGHTGRELRVPGVIAVAYLLLALAVCLRVFGPSLWPGNYWAMIYAAGIVWMTAFGIFAVVYTPVLLLPRVDGKPG